MITWITIIEEGFNIPYIRNYQYRDQIHQRTVLSNFEHQELIQGHLNIFVTSRDLTNRYYNNLNEGQILISSNLILYALQNSHPIEVIVYSGYDVEVRIYHTNIYYTVILVKLSRFTYTNLFKLFLISNTQRRVCKKAKFISRRIRWERKLNPTEKVQNSQEIKLTLN